MFKESALLISRRGLNLHADAIEFVKVDAQSLAINRVCIAVALERVPEEFPCLAHGLVEARSAAAGIVARPKRLEKFVATCRTPLHREVGDEFRCRLSPRLFLLAMGELERPEKQNTDALVARVTRYDV